MTEKEPIIIDGVDVAECQYLYFAIEDSIIDCKEHSRCSIGEAFTNSACKNSNCYFKQRARKTQECEELQYQLKCVTGREKGYKANSDFWEKHCEKLEEQLDQLKAENEKLKNEIEVCYNQVDDFDIIATSKSNKLKQAEQKLEKIYKLLATCKKNCDIPCELCEYSEQCEKEDTDTQILKIIDEVE